MCARIFPGQMAKEGLDSTRTSEMVKYAGRNPEYIGTSINGDAFDVLGFGNDSTLVCHSFFLGHITTFSDSLGASPGGTSLVPV